MKPHEIQEKLGLTRIRDRNWYVQPACATTGDGLYEGLTWLTSNHKSWIFKNFVKREILNACQQIFHSATLILKSEKMKILKHRNYTIKSEKDNKFILRKDGEDILTQ